MIILVLQAKAMSITLLVAKKKAEIFGLFGKKGM